MKLHLHLGHLSGTMVEVDDSPENCARFIWYLEQKQDYTHTKDSTKHQTQQDTSKTNTHRGEVSKNPHKQTRRQNREKQDFGNSFVRPYGGKTNRRSLIIRTLTLLQEEGEPCPDLATILSRFQSEYPEEPIEKLDQVVRDLCNKTNLIERQGRGRFRLSSP